MMYNYSVSVLIVIACVQQREQMACNFLFFSTCVYSLNPLFPGTNEVDQVAKIHDVLGTPDQSVLQKFKQ